MLTHLFHELSMGADSAIGKQAWTFTVPITFMIALAYQETLLDEYDRLAAKYHFETLDATDTIQSIFNQAKDRIKLLVSD